MEVNDQCPDTEPKWRNKTAVIKVQKMSSNHPGEAFISSTVVVRTR